MRSIVAGLGHKALAVNLSDVAACGAKPLAFTLALALPQAHDASAGPVCARPAGALAEEHGCHLVGGDATQAPDHPDHHLGEVPRGQALLRSGAHVGDDISGQRQPWARRAWRWRRAATTSTLPPALLARACQRMDAPTPRVALGFHLRGIASAARPTSGDGLVGDLGRHLGGSRGGRHGAHRAGRSLAARAVPPRQPRCQTLHPKTNPRTTRSAARPATGRSARCIARCIGPDAPPTRSPWWGRTTSWCLPCRPPGALPPTRRHWPAAHPSRALARVAQAAPGLRLVDAHGTALDMGASPPSITLPATRTRFKCVIGRQVNPARHCSPQRRALQRARTGPSSSARCKRIWRRCRSRLEVGARVSSRAVLIDAVDRTEDRIPGRRTAGCASSSGARALLDGAQVAKKHALVHPHKQGAGGFGTPWRATLRRCWWPAMRPTTAMCGWLARNKSVASDRPAPTSIPASSPTTRHQRQCPAAPARRGGRMPGLAQSGQVNHAQGRHHDAGRHRQGQARKRPGATPPAAWPLPPPSWPTGSARQRPHKPPCATPRHPPACRRRTQPPHWMHPGRSGPGRGVDARASSTASACAMAMFCTVPTSNGRSAGRPAAPGLTQWAPRLAAAAARGTRRPPPQRHAPCRGPTPPPPGWQGPTHQRHHAHQRLRAPRRHAQALQHRGASALRHNSSTTKATKPISAVTGRRAQLAHRGQQVPAVCALRLHAQQHAQLADDDQHRRAGR